MFTVLPDYCTMRFRTTVLRAFAPLAAAVALTACGETLGSRVVRSVDGCIAFRNAAFTSGQGTTALATPLPDSVQALGTKIAYARGFVGLASIAQQAPDQVTLVCALEIASFYRNFDAAVLLNSYTAHPDNAVSESARRLLAASQDPLPARFTSGK